MNIGVGGLVQLGAWCKVSRGMEVLAMGRGALSEEDCIMDVCWTLARLQNLAPARSIWLAASPMDSCAAPDLLLRHRDDQAGWQTLRRLLCALEAIQAAKAAAKGKETGANAER